MSITNRQFADLIRRTGRQAGFSFPNPVRRTKGLTMATKAKAKKRVDWGVSPVRKVKRATPVKRKPRVNMLFPAKANYAGPQRGWFGHVHHGVLAEHTTCDISDRVAYIKSHKPSAEQATRLRHLIYLGDALTAVLDKELKAYVSSRELRHRGDHVSLRKKVMAYCRRHIAKPYRWSEKKNSLVHSNHDAFTG